MVAEAIATAIREHQPAGGDVEPITASVGVAMFGDRPADQHRRRSSPRPTRRCTRPRTAAATASASSTRSRSATTPPGMTWGSRRPYRRPARGAGRAPAGPRPRTRRGRGRRREASPPAPARPSSAGARSVKSSRSEPARAAATPDFAGPPKARTATVSSASVIATPAKPSRRAQLAGGDRAGEGGGRGRERRVDRGAEHHQVAAGGDEGPVGRLVDLPQRLPSGGRSAAPRSRCFPAPRRGRGSAWRSPRRRPPAAPAANGTAVAATCCARRAEAAFGRRRSCRPAGRRREPGRGRR